MMLVDPEVLVKRSGHPSKKALAPKKYPRLELSLFTLSVMTAPPSYSWREEQEGRVTARRNADTGVLEAVSVGSYLQLVGGTDAILREAAGIEGLESFVDCFEKIIRQATARGLAAIRANDLEFMKAMGSRIVVEP